MGEVVVKNDEVVYQQENGEITAWLTNFTEKMELAHVGSPFYKKIFYLLAVTSVCYLVTIFLFF